MFWEKCWHFYWVYKLCCLCLISLGEEDGFRRLLRRSATSAEFDRPLVREERASEGKWQYARLINQFCGHGSRQLFNLDSLMEMIWKSCPVLTVIDQIVNLPWSRKAWFPHWKHLKTCWEMFSWFEKHILKSRKY